MTDRRTPALAPPTFAPFVVPEASRASGRRAARRHAHPWRRTALTMAAAWGLAGPHGWTAAQAQAVPVDAGAASGASASAAAAATAAASPAPAAALAPNALVQVTQHDFQGRALAPDAALRLSLSQPPEGLRGRLTVFVGPTDVTAMLQPSGLDLVYQSPTGALPLGHSEVVVMAVDQGQWVVVARLPLQVVAPVPATLPLPAGTAAARLQPKLDLQGLASSQQQQTSQGPGPGSHSRQLGLQGSLAGEWGDGVTGSGAAASGWQLRAQANVVGSSVRAQALRFAQLAAAADKVDLASYLLEGQLGATRFALGHVNVGNHPLLVNGLSFRGAKLTHALTDRLDIGLSAQDGSQTVGFDRPLGLYEQTHRMSAASLGYELFEDRGRLRLEISAVSARVSPQQLSLGTAPIGATQASEGLGLRATGQTLDQRARVDLAWAQSRYQSLADGYTPATAASTRNAWLLDTSYQLLKDHRLASGEPLSAVLTYRQERADPLYRSLAASTSADVAHQALGLQMGLGASALQVQATRRHDNLDRLPTALTNTVQALQLSVSSPLSQWFGPPRPAGTPPLTQGAWPTLQFSASQTTQRGTDVPATLSPLLVPHLVARQWQAGLAWTGATWHVGATLGHTVQDNRQPGSEGRDLVTHTLGLSGGWRPTEQLTLQLGLNPSRSRQTDTDLRRTTLNPNLSMNWQTPWQWQLASAVNFDRSFDNQALSGTRHWGWQNQVSRAFKLPAAGGLPAPNLQVSLRHFVSYGHNRTLVGVVDQTHTVRQEGVSLNLTLSVF